MLMASRMHGPHQGVLYGAEEEQPQDNQELSVCSWLQQELLTHGGEESAYLDELWEQHFSQTRAAEAATPAQQPLEESGPLSSV